MLGSGGIVIVEGESSFSHRQQFRVRNIFWSRIGNVLDAALLLSSSTLPPSNVNGGWRASSTASGGPHDCRRRRVCGQPEAHSSAEEMHVPWGWWPITGLGRIRPTMTHRCSLPHKFTDPAMSSSQIPRTVCSAIPCTPCPTLRCQGAHTTLSLPMIVSAAASFSISRSSSASTLVHGVLAFHHVSLHAASTTRGRRADRLSNVWIVMSERGGGNHRDSSALVVVACLFAASPVSSRGEAASCRPDSPVIACTFPPPKTFS